MPRFSIFRTGVTIVVIVSDHSQPRRWRRRGPQNVGFAMNIGGAISGRNVLYFVYLLPIHASMMSMLLFT